MRSALAAGAVAFGESTSSAPSTTDPHALLSDYQRPAKVPASKSNPMTPEKVALGQMLFFDPRLSGSGGISCATCHNSAFGWSSDACQAAEQASNSASEVATGTSEPSVKSARLDALRVVV